MWATRFEYPLSEADLLADQADAIADRECRVPIRFQNHQITIGAH